MTLTVPVAPASIVTVWARASAVGDAVTVQPCGAVGANVNVCSSGVLLVIVRLYVKSLAGSPFSDGKSAVSSMPLSTWVGDVERDLQGSRCRPTASCPLIVIGYEPGRGAGGHVDLERRLAGRVGRRRDGVDHEPAAAHRRRPTVGEAGDVEIDRRRPLGW